MPIYENTSDGSRVVHLGSGDVVIAHGGGAEPGMRDELVFISQKPHAVGEMAQLEGRSTDKVPTGVRIVFDSVDALDVLIERAITLRIAMKANRKAA